MITSAKAIWFLASGASFSRSESHLASATVTTASSRAASDDVLVDEEGLRHGRRVGEAGGLDDDRVELALALHQPVEDADQVAAHGAADAAVVHLEDFLVGADDEVVVDADLAELVDDDGVFLAVRLGEDAVEERRLAGAEIAGEHGDGDLVGHGGSRLRLQARPADSRNGGESSRSARQRRAEVPYIVAHHVDVSRRAGPLRRRERVGIERAADPRAGFLGDALA